MLTSEILELVRAGYTKAEIESLSGAEIQKEDTENVKQEAKQEAKQEVKQEAKQEVKQEVKQEENNGYKELLEVVNSLKDTVKAMQEDNAKKASNDQPKSETADSAIRSFFEDTPKN